MKSFLRAHPTRRSALLAMAAGSALSGTGTQSHSDPALQAILKDGNFRGCIKSAAVTALMKHANLSREALMTQLLPVARSFAHPPLSNYFVGAVALGSTGNFYLGANIEIPRNMLGTAVHAEQAAVANAYMSGESGIDAIAVTAPPCGHCRQFLSELSIASSMRVLVLNKPEMKLSDLLPMAFGPADLGFNQGALPIKRSYNANKPATQDTVTLEAIKAAETSYSPYTQSPSGAAIVTSTGRIFAGSYIENAAFNPSLPPLQAALAGYFAAAANAGNIQRVVLAEGKHNRISHQNSARSALAVLAPAAAFEIVLV